MARRPDLKPPGSSSGPSGPPPGAPPGPPPAPERGERERIIEAFLHLLAEHDFDDIDFNMIAARSGVSLDRCRGEFDSRLGIWAAHAKAIDRAVLGEKDTDMDAEPARERLFDVLMRRLEAHKPHREAVRSLIRSARRNPGLAVALNAIATRSQAWMLTVSGISATGLRGSLRAQGLACLYADVLRTWLNDDDPGLARTMAALDRQLARGARWSRCLDTLHRFAPGRGSRRRWEERDRRIDPGDQPAVV